MKTLDDFLQGVRTAAIAGHVNPDGDCIGSVLGIWPAAILSALLFGIYHANMIQFLYAFPLGILFAWYYEKSGTLLVPVLVHISLNFGACIFTMF